MQVVEVVRRMGGIADARTLVATTSRRKVRTAVRRGDIVRDGHGRFALPTAQVALRAANAMSAVLSHGSAAAYWGLEMKHPPAVPTLTVPRGRKVDPGRREGVDVNWADLEPEDVWDNRVTMPGRTVIDCAKKMPFDEALVVADSALRHDRVSRQLLLHLAEQVPNRGRAKCIRVAREADGRAANPFESVLRAIALDVRGLKLEPQVVIADGDFVVRPDLVDVERRIVVEAESFEFHSKRKALKSDCERYNGLARLRWVVLRFAWEHVMFEPAYVASILRAVAADRPRRRPRRRTTPKVSRPKMA